MNIVLNDVTRIIGLAISLISIGLWIVFAINNRDKSLYSITAVSWLITIAITYLLILFNVDENITRFFGGVVFLSGTLLMLAFAIYKIMLYKDKKSIISKLAKEIEEKY